MSAGTGEWSESSEAGPPPITATQVFAPSVGLHALELDQETVLVDVLRNRYIRLNPTGTFIWQRIVKQLPVGEISRQLGQQYGLTDAQASDTVTSYIRDLAGKGVVSPASDGTP